MTQRSETGTALYVVSEYAEFSSLLALAKVVLAELDLHPAFLFKHDYGALTAHTQQLDVLGFSWASAKRAGLHTKHSLLEGEDDYVPTSTRSTVAKDTKGRSRRAATLTLLASVGAIATAPVIPAAALAAFVFRRARGDSLLSMCKRLTRRHPGVLRWHYLTLLDEMRKVFDILRPTIIIGGQDYPLSTTSMASLVAEERGIRTAIVPFSMTPTTKEIAESFAGSRVNLLRGKLSSRLVREAFPQWINHYRGRDYTRLSLPEILVAEELGLGTSTPWVPNSGRGVLLLPGEQSVNYCRSAGIPPDQLRATGALWSDQLWRNKGSVGQRKADLVYDIDSYSEGYRNANQLPKVEYADDTKLLLVSWPPDQAPRTPTGLENFDDLSRTLCELLSRIHNGGIVRVAVSLHPTLVGRPLQRDLKERGIYIIDQNLVDVIDCADVFVATVSSTLLWSLQLEIPSVNLDIYRYGYREFGQAGIIDVNSIADLRSTLLSLIRRPGYYAEVREILSRNRGQWGMFDGECTKRILRELTELL